MAEKHGHDRTATPYTPGHLHFDDPTWDAKIALKGRTTVYGQPYVVAHVNRPGSARDGDDKKYARLFCAAPDLLAACRSLVAAMRRYEGDVEADQPQSHIDMMAQADAAIARASNHEGEGA